MENAFYENINKASYDYPHMEFYKENLTYLSHFHNEIELIYFFEGATSIFCDNKKIEGSAGDIFIFMPGQIHSFISTEPNKYHLWKLRCENETDGTDFSRLRTACMPINRDEELYKKLLIIINEFLEEKEEKRPGQAYFFNSFANRIVGEILRYGTLVNFDKKQDKISKFNTELLTKVNVYIEKNYHEKITISQMAKHCGLSDYYFAHTFKKITGITFFEHLTLFRLNKAINIYAQTQKALTETAYECGFSNTRSFYRLFKKYFAVPPKEYISKIKKQ